MKSGRLDFIDGLRGLAALTVVFQHIAERIMIHAPDKSGYLHLFFVTSINTGRFGIALFFLISGYVVPFSFKEPHAFQKFVISRFFRLYPAYWLSLAAAVAALTWAAGAQFETRTVLANITMLQMALGQPNVLGPYWTLIIELTFYGLCASLYLSGILFNRKALYIAFALFMGLSLVLSVYGAITGHYVSANLPLNLSLMFLGTILRMATMDPNAGFHVSDTLLLAAAFAAISIILFTAPNRGIPFYSNTGFCVGYWAGLTVFLLAVIRQRSSFVFLTSIGTVSYSLYLFHDIVLSIYERAFSVTSYGGHAVFALASLVTAIAISYVVYFAAERPSIRFGKIVSEGLAPKLVPKVQWLANRIG